MTRQNTKNVQDIPAPVTTGVWNEAREPARRRFPGPAGSGLPVRLAIDREAYADIAQHAKESLRAEICGVLVGQVCRDDEGLWVDVTASIRGTATSQGSSHVTFTQETWNQIHAEKERRHPAAAMVGWYHSHPGFGVEFSEMDAFIHQNFFTAPAQVALVTDPVGGEDAVCVNDTAGIRYLDRCWIDGRERRLHTPEGKTAATTTGADQVRIDALEARIAHLVATLDEFKERIWSFYLIVGMTAVLLLVMWLGWQFWTMWSHRYEPPEVMNEWSTPVRIGDVDMQLLNRIYGWKLPPEKCTAIIEMAKAEAARQAEEAKIKDAPPSAPAKVAPAPPDETHGTTDPLRNSR